MQKKKVKKQKKRTVENIAKWEVTDMTSMEEANESTSYMIPGTRSDHVTNKTQDSFSVEPDLEVAESKLVQKTKMKKKLKNGIMIQRSEASQNISEFNLNEVGKEKVKLNELIKTSQKLAGQGLVKKQLEKAKKLRSLSIPLSKPQLEKIKRTVAYEKICDEVGKWDPIVRSNRSAEQVIYPLKKPEIHLESFDKVSENFVTKHPVEIAVSELLKQSDNILQKEKPLTVAEEKALQAMSLEEAKLRHKELMKHRALISYQEAKARRQNKIKSKRYHRILKKEKLKKIMKEFDELEKTDASAALEKIMEADQLRIKERMTLKHRNTGKWAKMQKLRAKYNPEARTSLKEDINAGRQLREKLPEVEKTINKLKANLESQMIEDAEMSLYNDGLVEELGNKSSAEDPENFIAASESEAEPSITEGLLVTEGQLSLLDQFSLEKHLGSGITTKVKKTPIVKTVSQVTSDFLDMDFISKTNPLDSYKPKSVTIGDHMDELDDDDADNGAKNLSEAFANEELIAEFRKDKKAAEEANRPKGLDLFLPGWGSWGGAGCKVSGTPKAASRNL